MADMLQDMAKNLCDGQADAYAPDAASAVDLARELAALRRKREVGTTHA